MPEELANPKQINYKNLAQAAIILTNPIHLCAVTHCLLSKKITSLDQLVKIKNQECKKIGIDQEYVKIFYNPFQTVGFCGDLICNETNKPVKKYIELGGLFATRAGVRHELYHILKNHKAKSNLKEYLLEYYFIHEPQADLYQMFGIKI
mgnify:FL=1